MRSLLCVVLTAFTVALCPAQESLRREHTVPRHPLEFESIDGPRGEVVLSIVCTKQGVLLAGTRLHGVMRSTDGGDSWTQTSLRDEAVWPMYVTPGGHILAFVSRGMYKPSDVAVSTDNGDSWTLIDESSRKYYGHAVVRMSDNAIFSEGGGGLHRSTDDGASWETLQSEAPINKCYLDYQLVVLSDSVLFALCYHGLFRSGDGGRTWQKLPLEYSSFSELLADPAGGVLALGTDTVGTDRDAVLRISAGGLHVEAFPVSSWKGGERRFALLSAGTMLMGSASSVDGIIRSTDSAKTWVPTSVLSGSVNDFCQTPDGTVYAAMHGTIYRSFDDGMNWEECSNGLAKRAILHLFKDGEGGLYAGTELGGLYYSRDDGRRWTVSTTGLCTIPAGFSSAAGHVLLGTTSAKPHEEYTIGGMFFSDSWIFGYSMRISRDSARTWVQPRLESIKPLGLWRIIPGKGMRAYGSGRDLIISDDGGETWRVDPMFSEARDMHATSDGLYILRNDSVFFRPSDDVPWSVVRAEADVRAIGGSAKHIFAFERNCIARTADGGTNWETVSIYGDGLYDPRFISASGNTTLLMGDQNACYLTSNQGDTWQRVVTSAERWLHVTSAVLDSDQHLLLGSTEGLYRSTGPVPGSYVPRRFSLGIPWPNPVVSDLTIPYSLEEDGYVRLTLNDVVGRELVVLFEGHRNAGQYFQWVSRYLSEYFRVGVYFCNLSVNGLVQTQPLVFP